MCRTKRGSAAQPKTPEQYKRPRSTGSVAPETQPETPAANHKPEPDAYMLAFRWHSNSLKHGVFTGLEITEYFKKTLEAAEKIIHKMNKAVAGLNLVPNGEVATKKLEAALEAVLGVKVGVSIDKKSCRLKDVFVIHTCREWSLVNYPGPQPAESFIV